MCETENFSFLSADGIHQIQCRLWLPACPPRGVIQIVHGVAEHMGRYEDTASSPVTASPCAGRTI